jgi:hypothetical protein
LGEPARFGVTLNADFWKVKKLSEWVAR